MTPTPASQDITRLIVRVSIRDRAAFDLLYRRTSAKLFGVCLRVLRDRAEAEEALQEVFVKVWARADRFAASDLSPITWLVAIARNHAIDRLRSRRPDPVEIETQVDLASDEPGPETAVIAAGERDRIVGCLGELDAARSDAVRGAYLEDNHSGISGLIKQFFFSNSIVFTFHTSSSNSNNAF
jgi:RNA polymerase sigma-70 factor (ECF subfamily)